MRFLPAFAVLLVAGTAMADPAPRKLTKQCVAESPDTDVPCTKLTGTYHLKILPTETGEKCHIKAPLEADITIGKSLGHGGLVAFDGSKLIKKLGWKPRRDDKPEAGAAIDEGVCCIDARVYQTRGKPDAVIWDRLIIHIARGATKANGTAEERILHDGNAPGDCQNDLKVEVTLPR